MGFQFDLSSSCPNGDMQWAVRNLKMRLREEVGNEDRELGDMCI